MIIIDKIKGLLSNVGLERWAYYGVMVALIITTLIQCGEKKKCNEIASGYEQGMNEYFEISNQLDSMFVEYSRLKDDKPEGEVVEKIVEVEIENTERLERYWFRIEAEKAKNKQLIAKLEEAQKHNEAITKDQFDKEGGAVVLDTPIEKTLDIIETVKRDTGKNFVFEARVKSRSPLVSYDHSIEVTPEIIKIPTPGPTTYLKKDYYIGIAAGVVYKDSRNYSFPLTAQFRKKWWGVEAGPVFDSGLKRIEGAEVKLSAGIKF